MRLFGSSAELSDFKLELRFTLLFFSGPGGFFGAFFCAMPTLLTLFLILPKMGIFFLLALALCKFDVTDIGVFLRIDGFVAGGGVLSFSGDFLGLVESLCWDCAREPLRDLIGIRDGESGTTKSLSEDLDAADNSESLFGVPIMGDNVVGRDTLCRRGVGVFERVSSAATTLPLRDALACVLENGVFVDDSETLCLLGIRVPTFSLNTCITPLEARIGGIFFLFGMEPTFCRSLIEFDRPTSFLTIFDNVS